MSSKWRTKNIALNEWIEEEVQLTMCLMKDPALIKKCVDPFMFLESAKFQITNDEATKETKVY